MRCPHCAGEIGDDSRFCGICGRRLSASSDAPPPPPAAGPGRGEGSSLSLFELPVARGARAARVAIVLALDLLLAGAGIAMILAYRDAREAAAESPAELPDAGAPSALVEEGAPEPVGEGSGATTERPRDAGGAVVAGGDEPARGGGAPQPGGATAEGSGPTSGSGPAPEEPGPGPVGPGPDGPAPDDEPVDPGPDGPAPDPDEPVDPEPPGDEPSSPGEPTAEEIEVFTGRVSLVFRRHQAQMQRCYEQAAKLSEKDDALAGAIDVRFRVTAQGEAQDVRAVRNTTDSQQLARCVTGLVESWSFPKAPGGAPIDLKWPFRFSPP